MKDQNAAESTASHPLYNPGVPLISVVVPIYNVEHYLTACIESVTTQPFLDLELILVNDGSTDGSAHLCEHYGALDQRVRVIHKTNGGSADARNVGIRAARGKFLMFLDADDHWQGGNPVDNLVAELLRRPMIDVLVHNHSDYYETSGNSRKSPRNYDHQIMTTGSRDDVLYYLFSSRRFPGSAWTVVTRREFIVERQLFFPHGLKSEDIDWLFGVFLLANSFSSVDDDFYVYLRNRPGSITTTSDLQSIEDLLSIVTKWSTELSSDAAHDFVPYARSFLAFHFFTTFVTYRRLPEEQRAPGKRLIKSADHLLAGTRGFATRSAILLYRTLGVDVGSNVFSLYYYFRERSRSA